MKLPDRFRDIPCRLSRDIPGDEPSFHDAIEFYESKPWDIPEQVVVKLASVGSFFERQDNPLQPRALNENARTVMELIEAGVSGVHFNATSPDGKRIGGFEAYRQLVEPCRERYGNSFVADCNTLVGDTFEEQLGAVLGGIAEMSCLGGFRSRAWAQAAAEVMEANNCRPELVVHTTGDIELAERLLIRPGLVRKPYVWIVLAGAPSRAIRIMEYMPNQRAMCEGLLIIVNRIREIDPESFIMVCQAGRASIYLTTLAMLLGLHVRIGTEDTRWKYPHRSEIVTKNRELFEQTKAIAELLGRRIATGNEYRKMIGLPPMPDRAKGKRTK